MARTRTPAAPDPSGASGTSTTAPVNEVRLRGRLSGDPEERVLPSGDTVVSFRLVVERPPHEGRARVDTLDCSAFGAAVRRSLLRWQPGDLVEVEGALRRRFYAAGGARASRYDVEVLRASRVARGASSGRGTMAG